MITLDEFEQFIQNDLLYQQNLLFYIDDIGREHPIKNIGHLYSLHGTTIKMEGAEKYNRELFDLCKSFGHMGPSTCHIFRSYKNSKSFPKHADPDDVLLIMISGKKDIIIYDNKITLEGGNEFFITANTSHEIVNTEDSLMLSIGFEKFLVDKI